MSETVAAPPRRGRASRIALVVVLGVVVLLAILVVVAEFVLRGVVDRMIAQQVEQSLPSGTTGHVEAHAEGVVIPQLIRGRLDDVLISSRRITVQGIPLAAHVTAHDVPVDGRGSTGAVTGTVTLASGSVKDLAKFSPLFGEMTLRKGGVALAGSTSILGYSIDYSAKGTVAAQSDGRGVTVTPKSVAITNNEFGLNVDQIPGVTDTPVNICTAQFLPAPLRIRALDLTRAAATVRVSAASLPLSETGLRTTGTCS
jgi:hypothetical protein